MGFHSYSDTRAGRELRLTAAVKAKERQTTLLPRQAYRATHIKVGMKGKQQALLTALAFQVLDLLRPQRAHTARDAMPPAS